MSAAPTSADPAISGTGSPAGSPVPAAPFRRGRRLLVALGALAGAWLLPALTHLLGVDWLLLPVVVLGVAALLRGGATLLDRLVLAIVATYASTCVAGLLFSVWPWGLHPFPVAGTGLTLLVLAYLATGRRPVLPLRVRGGDLAVLGGTALVAFMVLWPLAQRDLGGRLGVFMHTVDFSRHLMMYDVIRVSGGYMFLHRDIAAPLVNEPGFLTYPQGGHFVAALTQNFVTSGTGLGSATAWAGNFVWLLATAYILMALTVLWSARHLAGRAGDGLLAALPLCGLVAGYLALGDLFTVFDRGYLQEITALALVAVVVALLCRPVGRIREQVVLVGVLLAATSFSYYLFLPVVAAMAAGWLLLYRRRIMRVWPLTLVTAVLSLAAAAVIPVVNRAASPGVVLLQNGQAYPVDRGVVFAMAAVAFAGLAALVARGSVVGRFGVFALAVPVLFALSVTVYQRWKGGADYFGIKAFHETSVVALVLAGAAVYLLPRVVRGGWAAARPRLRAVLVLGVAALAAAPLLASGADPRYHSGPGMMYLRGRTIQEGPAARTALAVYAAYPDPDERTVVVVAGGQWPQYLSTLYYGVFTHRFTPAAQFTNRILPWLGRYSPEEVGRRIVAHGRPTRVLADDPEVLAHFNRLAATLPPGQMEVVDLNTVRGR